MSENEPTDPIKNFLTPGMLAMPKLNIADLEVPTINPAEWMHERIVRSINKFEKGLDQDHEIGGRLVAFGTDMTFHIEDVGYWGPDIIIFHGVTQEGEVVELLQHTTQLSMLLVAMNKVAEEPRRIGFELIRRIESDEGG